MHNDVHWWCRTGSEHFRTHTVYGASNEMHIHKRSFSFPRLQSLGISPVRLPRTAILDCSERYSFEMRPSPLANYPAKAEWAVIIRQNQTCPSPSESAGTEIRNDARGRKRVRPPVRKMRSFLPVGNFYIWLWFSSVMIPRHECSCIRRLPSLLKPL